jgi:hypothetical protein
MYNDFKELLSALNAHGVRYLIIGGYAVSFHAEPRATKDLDILISPDGQIDGREEWLELRRKQTEKSAGIAPERSREHDDLTRDSEKGIDDDIEP